MLYRNRIQEIYRKRAATYDLEVRLFHLLGFREKRCRSAAVEALALKPGNTVIDIGCGTGRNFSYIREKTGNNARLTGVDLTKEMLEKAKKRVLRHGWFNVDLAHEDVSKFNFPKGVDGIISSFMFSTMSEHGNLIERAVQAIRTGGRFVILDVKEPTQWPAWCFKLSLNFIKPYGTIYEHLSLKPWETMEKYCKQVTIREFYAGAIYMAAGEI